MSQQRKELLGLGILAGFVVLILVLTAVWISGGSATAKLLMTALAFGVFCGVVGVAMWSAER